MPGRGGFSKRLKENVKFSREFRKPPNGAPPRLPAPALRAFDAFGLNPRCPGDWEELVFILADILFPRPLLRPGRPRGPGKWDSEALCQLLGDYCAIKRQFPKSSDVLICEKLVKDQVVGARYKSANQSPGTLRRNLQSARDPEKNHVLSAFFTDAKSRLRDKHLQQGLKIARSLEERIEKDALSNALERFAEYWGKRSKQRK